MFKAVQIALVVLVVGDLNLTRRLAGSTKDAAVTAAAAAAAAAAWHLNSDRYNDGRRHGGGEGEG